MATRIVMPHLGESVAEGTIGRWLKSLGEWVERDEPLVEVMTDKVNVEIPSPVAGRLASIAMQEGDVAPVGAELALVEEASGAPTSQPAEPVAAVREAGFEGQRPSAEELPQRLTPAVRRLAQEHGVDVAQIQGTGAGGRVSRDDVLAFVASRKAATPPAGVAVAGVERVPPPSARPAAEAPPGTEEGDQLIRVTPMRKAIAEHMVRSVQTAPHATAVVEVDMTSLVRWREAMRGAFRQREGFELSYVPLVMRAVIEGLRAAPMLNATWAGDRIVVKRAIHMGVAVALEDGLVVPVIRDAGSKTLAQLAREVDRLVEKARAGKLEAGDLQGGTFTLNNTGAFGTVVSTPIINQPQAGIVTMEAIVKRPVAINDAIAIRDMMNMCLSFDHRVVDGLAAGRFLQAVKSSLEGFDPTAL